MSGGLYRSVNAARGDDGAPADALATGAVSPLDPVGGEPSGPTTPPVPGPPPGEPDEPDDDAAGNSAMMAVLSLISRLTGFARTAVIVAALGGYLVGDAYATAQLFPGMVYELLLGGILTSVVIPVLVRRRGSDPDRGEAYTQRLLTLTVLTLGVATVLTVFAAPVLAVLYAGANKPEAFRELVTNLSYLMLPIMFFSGVSALFSGILNTRGHFAAPMWTPILNNLVVIGAGGLYIALFGATAIQPQQMTPGRIAVIGGGTLLGVIVQAIGLWPALRRVGFRWRWRFDFRALGLAELGRLGGWVFCYVAVSQVGVLVLMRLLNEASGAGTNAGPLIYNAAFLLLMMAHGIVAVSIITALMPRMSAAAADGRFAELSADLSQGSRMAAAVLAPIAVCYAVLSGPIPVVLFENGAYNRDNSLTTSLVLLMAALALVPFAISQLFTFALYALTDTKAAAMINIPVVALRIGVQVALFYWLDRQFTAAGLMVGNAVSYLLAVALSAMFLRSRIGRLDGRRMAASFGKVLVAAGVSAVAGWLVLQLVLGGDPTGASRLHNLVALAVGGVVVCAVYGGAALLLRVREVTDVVTMVRRRIGR
ncbi:MAG TPA: murein biosynthesis integral membrane protein MurJ [Catenuloplanes sp.]